MAAARVLIAGGGTGGHLFPALNIADALRRLEPQVGLMMIGARRGVEARVLPERDIDFDLLPLHPIYRQRPWRNWRLVASAFPVFNTLRRTLGRFDPHVVVGTGGYASGPAVLAGILSGRRTALQEQNANPGLVSKRLAPYVDQIHLGYPEARILLKPGSGTEVFTHGNPVARPESTGAERMYDWPDGRIVAVIGGSQGALGINEAMMRDLRKADDWPADLSLVWITGPAHVEEIRAEVAGLATASRIRVEPFIPDLGAQMHRITLAVSRAGAMTTSELAVAGVPAVLVPLPTAAADHQARNALALERAGAAVMLSQDSLDPGRLWRTVLELLGTPGRLADMADTMKSRGRPDAADRIAEDLLRIAGGVSHGDGGHDG